MVPWGEWKPDVSDYLGTASKLVRNVVPRGDGYGPFPSSLPFSTALPAACRGAFFALKSDGSTEVFAGTATKLYRMNNTTYGWVDVSKGAGSYGALSANAQWQFAQTGNLVWATHANVVLQVYDMGSATAFADGLGSPPQAAYISTVGRFLVLSGLLSTPYRIQWSGLNNYNSATSWTSGVSSSDFQEFPDGGIVRGVAGGEFGLIFQDQAIRRMSYVGGNLIFQIERITQDMGLFAPYSIARAGQTILFYSGKGFYKIDPGGLPVQVGREKVDRTFSADLDRGNMQLFTAASDPRTTRVYWAYRSVGSVVSGSYDKILGYDIVLDRWFTLSVSGEYLFGLSQAGLTLEALDTISLSLDALTLSLDGYAAASQPEISQFDTSHRLSFFRGPSLEATMQTAEQGTDNERIFVRGFRPVTDAASFFGSINYRETIQATTTVGAESAVNTRTGRCDFRRSTRYGRFVGRIPAATTWTYTAGVEPDVVKEGSL